MEVIIMENDVREVEILDEGAETTEMVSACCTGGTQSARN